MKNSEEIRVTRYGLHQTPEGVHFLHQGGASGHNFIGWPKPSPFKIEVGKGRGLCPHNFSPNVGHPDRGHWEKFIEMYEDPLFRACLPLPKVPGEATPFLVDNHSEAITLMVVLSRLSSPVVPLVVPFNRMTPYQVGNALSLTNVAPLILHSVTPEDQMLLNQIVNDAQTKPRKLILLGHSEVVIRMPMKRITTILDTSIHPHQLLSLPLESLGTVALRRFCRDEQINAPFAKKE